MDEIPDVRERSSLFSSESASGSQSTDNDIFLSASGSASTDNAIFHSASGSASTDNATFLSAVASQSMNNEREKYAKQLRLEIKQWNELLRAKCDELQQKRNTSAVVDQSILTEAQKRYLADGPTVESFMAETEAFDNALTAYIERKSFLMQRNAHIVHEAKVLVELALKDSIANDLMTNDE